MTLLEEMKSIKGNLKVDGSVFYVQQEPWIFSASLRQNITFGKPYIRAKFNEIIKACCLEQVNLNQTNLKKNFKTIK